ncbi:unnamed protein product [Eruca vesicaria subsp. sativa]|uniref:Uncharacterized protein n=1 Tax=Eruca vesicaria subsp. sativa TaxID=29727 RepID=A0ABC8LDT3_ERUVS|nr:unnamed protein product [Eruca vesicaria subsp. sativa]
MSSFISENVAAEKVDAMRRFERTRNLWKFLPVIEALVAVLLLVSWLSPSLSVGEYLRRIISGGLSGGIFIFVVVNVLIGIIFSLSNHHQKVTEPDLYFQYVSSSATTTTLGGFSSATTPPGGCSSSSVVVSECPASDNEEKTSGIITSGTNITSVTLTAEEARPMKREMVRAISSVAETAHAVRRKHDMTFLPPVATESTSDHQVYRRSRSERLDVRGDFSRSMRRLCEIDDLSSDEFRSTVETFIAGKKKMLLKEWMKP